MATEEQKKANMLRLAKLTLYGLTTGIWDLVGEGALGLSRLVGDEILPVLEKEMGLELTGESLVDIVTEVGRLFVDEFGFAQEVEIETQGDRIIMKVRGCANRKLSDDLRAAGMEKPFICPFLCVVGAVLDRMGQKAMSTIEKWEEGKGSIITFELI